MNRQTDKQMDQVQDQHAANGQLQRQLVEAQDSLDREVYRLETAEIGIRIAEEEIAKLESLTLAAIVSSFFGNKAGRIDALRAECENLQRESRERAGTVEMLERQVAQIKQQIEALGEIEAPSPVSCVPGNGQIEAGRSLTGRGEPQAVAADALHRLERAIEAGESLLSQLGGTYGLCSRLRSGSSASGRSGALLSAVIQSSRNRAASTVTGQIADSVGHFCNQLGQLGLDPENASDAEILASVSHLRAFVDAGSGVLNNKTDAWAELEILVRNLVSDLQEMLAQRAPCGR